MCLGVVNGSAGLVSSCEEPNQRWKWVSRGRLFNLGTSLCVGVNTANATFTRNDSPLALYTCDREPPRVQGTWNCADVLDKLNSVNQLASLQNLSFTSAALKVYGDDQDLCSKTYQGGPDVCQTCVDSHSHHYINQFLGHICDRYLH